MRNSSAYLSLSRLGHALDSFFESSFLWFIFSKKILAGHEIQKKKLKRNFSKNVCQKILIPKKITFQVLLERKIFQ